MPGQRDDPQALSRLLVPSRREGADPARFDRASSSDGLGPSRIDRFNRQFASACTATSPGAFARRRGRRRAARHRRTRPAPGYRVKFSGQVKILEETTTNMLLAFGLASIFMYMVLAAQFESLAHPFIILTDPAALHSVCAAVADCHRPHPEPVQRPGCLLLLGIVKKNGILQIDYMNRLRDEGHSLKRRVVEANRVRLRPILMTTLRYRGRPAADRVRHRRPALRSARPSRSRSSAARPCSC
jgi:hydrophobic/amphiphilic exporter-1 (mainly G- bacteria), HAE1 family